MIDKLLQMVNTLTCALQQNSKLYCKRSSHNAIALAPYAVRRKYLTNEEDTEYALLVSR